MNWVARRHRRLLNEPIQQAWLVLFTTFCEWWSSLKTEFLSSGGSLLLGWLFKTRGDIIIVLDIVIILAYQISIQICPLTWFGRSCYPHRASSVSSARKARSQRKKFILLLVAIVRTNLKNVDFSRLAGNLKFVIFVVVGKGSGPILLIWHSNWKIQAIASDFSLFPFGWPTRPICRYSIVPHYFKTFHFIILKRLIVHWVIVWLVLVRRVIHTFLVFTFINSKIQILICLFF